MRISFVAAAALLAGASYVWAHHAFAAEFDINKPLKLQGVVTESGCSWADRIPMSCRRSDEQSRDRQGAVSSE